jgi:hypothetical protein
MPSACERARWPAGPPASAGPAPWQMPGVAPPVKRLLVPRAPARGTLGGLSPPAGGYRAPLMPGGPRPAGAPLQGRARAPALAGRGPARPLRARPTWCAGPRHSPPFAPHDLSGPAWGGTPRRRGPGPMRSRLSDPGFHARTPWRPTAGGPCSPPPAFLGPGALVLVFLASKHAPGQTLGAANRRLHDQRAAAAPPALQTPPELRRGGGAVARRGRRPRRAAPPAPARPAECSPHLPPRGRPGAPRAALTRTPQAQPASPGPPGRRTEPAAPQTTAALRGQQGDDTLCPVPAPLNTEHCHLSPPIPSPGMAPACSISARALPPPPPPPLPRPRRDSAAGPRPPFCVPLLLARTVAFSTGAPGRRAPWRHPHHPIWPACCAWPRLCLCRAPSPSPRSTPQYTLAEPRPSADAPGLSTHREGLGAGQGPWRVQQAPRAAPTRLEPAHAPGQRAARLATPKSLG